MCTINVPLAKMYVLFKNASAAGYETQHILDVVHIICVIV